jgi:hypothetical protein
MLGPDDCSFAPQLALTCTHSKPKMCLRSRCGGRFVGEEPNATRGVSPTVSPPLPPASSTWSGAILTAPIKSFHTLCENTHRVRVPVSSAPGKPKLSAQIAPRTCSFLQFIAAIFRPDRLFSVACTIFLQSPVGGGIRQVATSLLPFLPMLAAPCPRYRSSVRSAGPHPRHSPLATRHCFRVRSCAR